jgi:hypothetical protein
MFCRSRKILLRHNGGLLKAALSACLGFCLPRIPSFENLPQTLANTF